MIQFENSKLVNMLNLFIKKKSNTEKIFISSQEIEVLLLSLNSIDPKEVAAKKKNDRNFFSKLINQIKEELEIKSDKLLFLTFRHGNRVIIDSWKASWQDWEIESTSREPGFLDIRDHFFKAKEKFPAIKCFEDYIVVITALEGDKLKVFFKHKDEAIQIRKALKKLTNR